MRQLMQGFIVLCLAWAPTSVAAQHVRGARRAKIEFSAALNAAQRVRGARRAGIEFVDARDAAQRDRGERRAKIEFAAALDAVEHVRGARRAEIELNGAKIVISTDGSDDGEAMTPPLPYVDERAREL